jgi:inorganic pyrophosphatase
MLEGHIPRLALALVAAAVMTGCASSGGGGGGGSASLEQKDPYTLVSKINLLSGYKAVNPDGTINVVVEIPAGTNQKWEVSADGNTLVWEFDGDQPRVIDYLPYPGNYGMIPRTLRRLEQGGDGGALDVMVLGPGVPRGSVIRARPIGVIELLDRGEQDDKILAVMEGSPLERVTDVQDLDREFPGARTILKTWFSNYVGKSMVMLGVGSRAAARGKIEDAAAAHRELH